jgi:2Fe-2S ferredoxin
MPDITFIHPDGHEQGFEAPAGVSLMQAATGHGVDAILAECGGTATCGTCHVYVEPAWLSRLPAAEPHEVEMLDFVAAPRQPGSRLACQIRLTPELQGLVVRLPEHQV